MSYVYGIIIHVDIRDGKIWIQRDFTEEGVASELVDLAVPKAFKEIKELGIPDIWVSPTLE